MRISLPVLLGAPLLIMTAGCGSSSSPGTSTGPIDGAYVISGWSCGSTNILTALNGQGISAVALSIANLAGTLDLTFGSSCVETNTDTFSYPASGTFTLNEGAVTCSTGCTSQCTAGPGSGRADTYTYSVSGATVTSTRTLTSAEVSGNTLQADVGCTAGQTETITLTKMPD